MDCNRSWAIIGRIVLALMAVTCISGRATAQVRRGMTYNPVTQQMEPAGRSRRPAAAEETSLAEREPQHEMFDLPNAENAQPDFAVEQAAYEVDEYYDSGCDDVCAGCSDLTCGGCVGDGYIADGIFLGFEATFVKPRFDDNAAFTVMESNGTTTAAIDEVDFNYDTEFTPRVFMGWQNCDGLGLRATWWQFDHAAGTLSENPPANGFGEVAPPPFGDIDISTNVPTDVVTAGSDLNAHTIDLEATRQAALGCWNIGVGGGLRYAFAEQHYLVQVRDSGDDLRGEIDFRHSIEGIGPTISLEAYRTLTPTLSTFCKGRGSVLFGDGESRLEAGEDLDLTDSFTTTSTTSRDDLLGIGEIQFGVRWQALRTPHRIFTPFLTTAFEGQIWNGAGSATSEEGNLGFVGFNVGFGLGW